jgi:hypothetical protein
LAKTTHTDWHKIVDDIANAIGFAASGHQLVTAIKNHRVNNEPIALALTCGQCLQSMYFAAEKIAANHLHKTAPPVAIECPNCGHDGNHHYDGVVTTQ